MAQNSKRAKTRVLLGSDHAGYHMRMKLFEFLEEEGFEPIMFGASGAEPVDYPDVVHELLDAFHAPPSSVLSTQPSLPVHDQLAPCHANKGVRTVVLQCRIL